MDHQLRRLQQVVPAAVARLVYHHTAGDGACQFKIAAGARHHTVSPPRRERRQRAAQAVPVNDRLKRTSLREPLCVSKRTRMRCANRLTVWPMSLADVAVSLQE